MCDLVYVFAAPSGLVSSWCAESIVSSESSGPILGERGELGALSGPRGCEVPPEPRGHVWSRVACSEQPERVACLFCQVGQLDIGHASTSTSSFADISRECEVKMGMK